MPEINREISTNLYNNNSMNLTCVVNPATKSAQYVVENTATDVTVAYDNLKAAVDQFSGTDDLFSSISKRVIAGTLVKFMDGPLSKSIDYEVHLRNGEMNFVTMIETDDLFINHETYYIDEAIAKYNDCL
jgi:hypothetical protein